MTHVILIALIAISQVAAAAAGGKKERQDDATVTGLVVINDKTYRATCNCPSHVDSLENMIYLSRGLWYASMRPYEQRRSYPSKVKIRTHGTYRPEEHKLVRDTMQLLPQEDFKNVRESPLSPMDGRVTGKSFYAPGGDLGVFTMAMLNMYEGNGTPTQETATALLRQYLRQLPEGRLFRHATDDKALEAIRKALKWEVLDLANVDPQHRRQVNDAIAGGAIGDPFLSFLVRRFNNQPSKKSRPSSVHRNANTEIVLACITAFLEIAWDKTDATWERTVLQVLHGEHAPQALVEISVSKGCELARLAPQVPTRAGEMQLLVYSECAANLRKREVAAFLYNQQEPRKRAAPLDEVMQHLDKLAPAKHERRRSLAAAHLAQILVPAHPRELRPVDAAEQPQHALVHRGVERREVRHDDRPNHRRELQVPHVLPVTLVAGGAPAEVGLHEVLQPAQQRLHQLGRVDVEGQEGVGHQRKLPQRADAELLLQLNHGEHARNRRELTMSRTRKSSASW
ncbi:uncharacterized protein BcabD6B2_55390 [Babesia caballi]|uniref:Membrane protein, putative n=1 Tax=Babesia caballi TaxID=5871 RepID=A0AAV4M157_BABCB|nr:membrane protein, putative [Babesia caballi]